MAENGDFGIEWTLSNPRGVKKLGRDKPDEHSDEGHQPGLSAVIIFNQTSKRKNSYCQNNVIFLENICQMSAFVTRRRVYIDRIDMPTYLFLSVPVMCWSSQKRLGP